MKSKKVFLMLIAAAIIYQIWQYQQQHQASENRQTKTPSTQSPTTP